ncbi:Nup85 nucleoporin-domain-containing protein [Lipomyces japonicus]|uniref:Nup85 nucleoporin-domain-containing protein n=1 Tax=Lipomyces japonicus TaxID=56871 RepID=UPI0034CE7F2A
MFGSFAKENPISSSSFTAAAPTSLFQGFQPQSSDSSTTFPGFEAPKANNELILQNNRAGQGLDLQRAKFAASPLKADTTHSFEKKGALRYKIGPFLDGTAWVEDQSDLSNAHGTIFSVDLEERKFSPDYVKYVVETHNLYYDLVLSEENTSNNENKLPQYTTTYLHILDAARLRTEDEYLDDAYIVANCLISAFFVPSGTTRAGLIMEWVNRTDQRPTIEQSTDIMTSPIPSDEPEFWSFVHKLALRGLFLQCSNCLQKSGIEFGDAGSSSVFQSLISVLDSAPRGEDWQSGHRTWRARVITFAESVPKVQDIRLRKGVSTIFNILRGDADTILALSDTWQEATAAMFLFHDPSPVRLTEYFEKVVKVFPVDDTLEVERACAAVFSTNIPTALAILEVLDVCAAAHVADFCDRQGMLDAYFDMDTLGLPSFRDYLFLEHGEACTMNKETWFIGVSYLRETDSAGSKGLIEETLKRTYPDSEETLDQLLEIARELGLESAYHQIVNSWSKIKLFEGKIGDALISLADIGNYIEMRGIVWKLFEDGLTNGIAIPDLQLQKFLSSPEKAPDAVREFIAPYALLFQFFNSKQDDDVAQASQYLSTLLQFKFLPAKYFAVLITLLESLLDRKHPRTLPIEELTGVITELYKWEKNKTAYEEGIQFLNQVLKFKGQHEDSATELVQRIRHALIKEISRAFLEGE